MIHIVRGTTPTLLFELPLALETINKCEISFKLAGTVLTISTDNFIEIDAKTCKAKIKLTQQQTLGFKSGYNGLVQVRIIDKNNDSWATKLEDENAKFTVGNIIKDGVL